MLTSKQAERTLATAWLAGCLALLPKKDWKKIHEAAQHWTTASKLSTNVTNKNDVL